MQYFHTIQKESPPPKPILIKTSGINVTEVLKYGILHI